METHTSSADEKRQATRLSEYNCPCTEVTDSCSSCSGKKIVFVINFERRRIEEAILMGVSESNTAWIKVDAGKFNEIVQTATENIYGTAEHAKRKLFKHKLSGVFNRNDKENNRR